MNIAIKSIYVQEVNIFCFSYKLINTFFRNDIHDVMVNCKYHFHSARNHPDLEIKSDIQTCIYLNLGTRFCFIVLNPLCIYACPGQKCLIIIQERLFVNETFLKLVQKSDFARQIEFPVSCFEFSFQVFLFHPDLNRSCNQ